MAGYKSGKKILVRFEGVEESVRVARDKHSSLGVFDLLVM